jgi:hypothetical protein
MNGPINALRFGFLWPIILVGGWGWLDKNDAWGWFWAAVALGVVAFVGAVALNVRELYRKDAPNRTAAADREDRKAHLAAAQMLSPESGIIPNALRAYPEPDRWFEVNGDGSCDFVRRVGPGKTQRVTRRFPPQ